MDELKFKEFKLACNKYDELREKFVLIKNKKHKFEFLIEFDKLSVDIWALRQQTIVGDINVLKENFMDKSELSWMWSWIKGNQKWHAWNRLKGISRSNAMQLLIYEVKKLDAELPTLTKKWTDIFLQS